MTTDPVCGMDLEESQAKAKAEYEGKTYYFCSDACREEFEAYPEQYALGAGAGSGTSPTP
jgi:YHS domain-containing protein